jgi:hypothetical protein
MCEVSQRRKAEVSPVEVAFIVIPLVIVLALVIRLAAGGMDHGRLREYVESRGGRLLEARWTPFGPGWFGEKSDRIYSVRYLDADGNEHEAHCKTSMWTGVYFTRDEIVGYAQPMAAATGRPVSSLEEENRRLREEIERLRRQQRGSP